MICREKHSREVHPGGRDITEHQSKIQGNRERKCDPVIYIVRKRERERDEKQSGTH